MKDILMSIKPYYYYLIGEDIKKIEVRKNFPKSNDWKRQVRLYMSKDEKSFSKIPKEFQEKYRKHFGKVGLEFVCDRIDDFRCCSVPYKKESNLGYENFIDNGVYKVSGWHEGIVFERSDRYIDTMLKNKELNEMCLSAQEIFDYIGIGKHLYGWHISDLKIYDKPKELGEFSYPAEHNFTKRTIKESREMGFICHGVYITRPPMSWCYIEE